MERHVRELRFGFLRMDREANLFLASTVDREMPTESIGGAV